MTNLRLWTAWAFVIGVGFILGGIWTRWLLEGRLLQTGAVFLGVSLILAAIEELRY